jgi:hypothetical protein
MTLPIAGAAEPPGSMNMQGIMGDPMITGESHSEREGCVRYENDRYPKTKTEARYGHRGFFGS